MTRAARARAASACRSAPQIAEAASHDAPGMHDPHFADCLTCRRRLDAERALRQTLQRMPAPALAPARRRELAAELLAVADQIPARPAPWWRSWSVARMQGEASERAAGVHLRGWPAAPGGTGARSMRPVRVAIATAALAAAGVAAAWPVPRTATAIDPPAMASSDPPRSRVHQVAPDDAPPPPPPRGAPPAARVLAGPGAELSAHASAGRDVLTLTDGEVTIDARAARDLDVAIGDTTVRIADAKVTVRAHQRAIVSVQVVLGAARILRPAQRLVVSRGSLWVAEPAPDAVALRAFRDGWIALRAGRNRDAIALLDAATDATVAEEAAYWAAIATRRAGDADGARARLVDFVRRFPRSAYVAQADAILAAP